MVVQTSTLTVPGERDEDGYLGAHPVGTEYVLSEGAELLVALRFNAAPDEIRIVAHLSRGRDRPLAAADFADGFPRDAARRLYAEDGVRVVTVRTGGPVPVPRPG
jgi:hypothetical protein